MQNTEADPKTNHLQELTLKEQLYDGTLLECVDDMLRQQAASVIRDSILHSGILVRIEQVVHNDDRDKLDDLQAEWQTGYGRLVSVFGEANVERAATLLMDVQDQ